MDNQETNPSKGKILQRLRLALPNQTPPDASAPWWVRHKRWLALAEWILAGLLLITAIVAAWRIWFTEPPEQVSVAAPAPPPTEEEFRNILAALPPLAPDSIWKPEKLSDRWVRIVIHHTATEGGSAVAIDRYHREVNKWQNGLGYHFLIGNGNGAPDGGITVSHRWKDQLDGSHAKTRNKDSIGIALVGNFEKTLPSAKQMAALRGLVAYLSTSCKIPHKNIVGHKDLKGQNTACPGQYFWMDDFVSVL